MKLYSVNDSEFEGYGRVITGYEAECAAMVHALTTATPLPDGTDYVAEDPALQTLPEAEALGLGLYGGMPVQFGWCNGHNTKLNCLEYHRDSEFNLGVEDFILLLSKEKKIKKGMLDTDTVKAFRVPAGVLVEVYATTLHYAPCHTDPAKGFKVMVALPKGTNGPMPRIAPKNAEDAKLRACNKWLLAHAESAEAADGAVVALKGKNIDIAEEI